MKTSRSITPGRRTNSSSLVRKTVPLILSPQCDVLESELIEYVKGFKADVSESIALNQVLFKNNLPQRCLKHNNVLTLYCQRDRLPLCVSCMYHGNEHKNHKVIPLKNAGKSIHTDTQNYANKIQRRIEEIQCVVRTSTQNIVKIERIYPEICGKIQQGFRQLHELLIRKEDEHIKDLYLLTEKLRSNHLVLIQEMTKLLNIFVDKASFQNTGDQEMNVFKRSVLATIVDSNKYIQVEVKPIQFNLYPQYNSAMFTEIQNLLVERLELKTFPDIIVLNQQNYDPQGLSKLSENVEINRVKDQNVLSKSQHIAKFKMSEMTRGPYNMPGSPLTSRRSRRE